MPTRRLALVFLLGVEWLACDVIVGDRGCELRQVLGPLISHCLEPRSERDQLRLAERSAEEGEAERDAENVRGRYLHVRVASRSAETRAAEDEVIAVQEIGRPGWVVRR